MATMTINAPASPRPLLGDCLKAARRARNLTLKDVSERTGMALSTLSKVENHQMSLTYDKLLQLSAGLGMEVAELFHPVGAAAPASAVPTARRSVSRGGEGQFIRTHAYGYHYQCTELLGKRMVPIIAELQARTLEEFGPLMRHAGEEYLLVLEGRVAVHTEFYAPEILEAGDGIYIDSTMAHAYLNAGAGRARAICVCSADNPDLYEQLQELARGAMPPG
ncbi:helix-turn-helix domain-containing protein [Phreatobacter sp. AB_2022a]|uniref:helix-turn-helix domain-containing protein n=1 Tax=Phreatobacter sp. AB_2022a TaxID=3003134 RepID=UPI002286E493|nr:XRE family transcriptional regulator [Phreatobacter sp. AB_2022a]MCZ0733615.1 XRE family transcriptional regulator [Phreatobacter sp. AB_2022a]